jgi:hypothetical protein
MAFGSRDDLILPRSPEPSDEFMKMAASTISSDPWENQEIHRTAGVIKSGT